MQRERFNECKITMRNVQDEEIITQREEKIKHSLLVKKILKLTIISQIVVSIRNILIKFTQHEK